MLVEVEGDVCEVWVVVKEDLFQIGIADYLFTPALVHQIDDDLDKKEGKVSCWSQPVGLK